MIQSVRSSRKLSWLALSCLLAGIALSACQLTPSYSQSTNQTNPDRATVIGNAQPGPGAATDQMTTPAGLEIIPELSPAVNRSAGWPDLPEITQMPTPTLAPDPTATPAPTLAPTATPIPTRAPTSTPRPTAAPTPKPTSPPTPTPDPNTIQIHLAGVPGNWPPSGSQQSRVDQFIILVNEARAAEGLPALKTGSASLRELAAIRAAEVSINFSHDRPTTLTSSIKWYSLLKAFNIGFLWAGENICGGPSTPAAALTVFMNSTGHRANILSSEADTIAIGVYTDAAGKDWWAQNFIKAR